MAEDVVRKGRAMKSKLQKNQSARRSKVKAIPHIIYELDRDLAEIAGCYDADQSERLATKLEKWSAELRVKARFERMLESPKGCVLS